MDIRIDIGREVEGANAYLIPSTCKRTSRHHATLHWHDGVATLEDKSSNGTFVNGRRITQAQIKDGDTVWLGGDGTIEGSYRLDVGRLFATCRAAEGPRRDSYPRQNFAPSYQNREAQQYHSDNYAREFAQLKKTYINYHEELSKLKSKSNMKMQLPRVLISLIPIVIVAIILFIFREKLGMMSMVVMMGVSVLGGLIGTLTMGRTSSKQEKLSEDILDLQLKYQKDYKCPKCGKQYNLDMHWKKLQADGKCPYGCGAQFV